MAWGRPIVKFCAICGKQATHEVLNNQNALHGCYCQRCATKEIDRLKKEEEIKKP